MSSPDGRPGEFALIARWFAPLADAPGALGLKDDAAVLAPPDGADLVVTADTLVAGRHFFADDPPGAIARKALRVNLSDLAAKAAAPLGFLLCLALPGDWSEDWLDSFAEGLGADARAYGAPLLGGDTVRGADALIVTITAFGHVPRGRMPRRAEARPGDALYVSGTIGDAALGLALRREAALGLALGEVSAAHLAERYLLPRPRLALAPALLAHARAAMDVSDGLAGDLAKLLAASGASGRVEVPSVPLSPAAAAARDARPGLIETILTGGDDYEILAAIAPGACAAFEAEAAAAGVPVARIGEVTAGQGPARFLLASGEPLRLPRASFAHF